MSMTKEQYLLTKLAEEASEITKSALKAQQFGLDRLHIETNRKLLYKELNYLFGVIALLNETCNFNYLPNEYEVDCKIKKIKHYYEISKKLGTVE